MVTRSFSLQGYGVHGSKALRRGKARRISLLEDRGLEEESRTGLLGVVPDLQPVCVHVWPGRARDVLHLRIGNLRSGKAGQDHVAERLLAFGSGVLVLLLL